MNLPHVTAHGLFVEQRSGRRDGRLARLTPRTGMGAAAWRGDGALVSAQIDAVDRYHYYSDLYETTSAGAHRRQRLQSLGHPVAILERLEGELRRLPVAGLGQQRADPLLRRRSGVIGLD